MKVIDLIGRLKSIGFDEKTEITFSCVNGDIGEWHDIPFKQLNFGEDLNGEPYNNDVIDVEVDMDSVTEYANEKVRAAIYGLRENLIIEMNKWI